MKRLTDIANSTRGLLAVLLASAVTLTSCNNFLFEEEGDCDPHYKVRFEYTYHMKQGDAFPYEVNSVTLYLVDDRTGKVVWQKQESGEALRSHDYAIDVEVAPGTYSLVAWCGDGHNTTFRVNDTEVKTELQCHLITGETYDDPACDTARHTREVNPLYHGRLDAQTFPADEGTHIFTVPLVKNTNDIHVLMQHLSGDMVDISKFSFTITDDNAHMDWNNDLVGHESICYHPWRLAQGSAETDGTGVATDDTPATSPTRAESTHSAALAEFTVARLHTAREPRLVVRNGENKVVASIPLVHYFTLLKGRHIDMDDQEFLDRQDDYSLVLFLDKNQHWVKMHINILSWHMVIQNTGV